jgi:hypothetical protein
VKHILLLILAAGLAAAEPCATCTETKLCESHAQADKEAMKALREWLGQADPDQRVRGLEDFAKSCMGHANCRPAVNAQAMAAALKDPDARVRARAAELLGETQDPRLAGTLLSKEVSPLVKKLMKEPRSPKEEETWVSDFTALTGILKGLGMAASPEAGVGIAEALKSTRIKVLDVATREAPKVRAKVVVEGLMDAFARVVDTPSETSRNALYMAMIDSWEKLTSRDIRRPDTRDGADGDRYAVEMRQWWKANEAKWK